MTQEGWYAIKQQNKHIEFKVIVRTIFGGVGESHFSSEDIISVF